MVTDRPSEASAARELLDTKRANPEAKLDSVEEAPEGTHSGARLSPRVSHSHDFTSAPLPSDSPTAPGAPGRRLLRVSPVPVPEPTPIAGPSRQPLSQAIDARATPHLYEAIIGFALQDPEAHPVLRAVNRHLRGRVAAASMAHVRIKADWGRPLTMSFGGFGGARVASLVLAYPHADRAIPGLTYDLDDTAGMIRTRALLGTHTRILDEPLDVRSIYHVHLDSVYKALAGIETFRTGSSSGVHHMPCTPSLVTYHCFRETCLTPWEGASPLWCDFVSSTPSPSRAVFTIAFHPHSAALPSTFARWPSHDTCGRLEEIVVVFRPVPLVPHAMTRQEMERAESHAERSRNSPDGVRMLGPLAALVLDKPTALKVTLVGMEALPAACLGDWCTEVQRDHPEGWFTTCLSRLLAINVQGLQGDVHDLDESVREVTLAGYRDEVGEATFRLATEVHADVVRGTGV
ncbi:hypothetical protein Q8F55_009255 [Vanrija albida]|uniref:Uncharacterized protein n=1 Tax=Vanrija albida TaxID=181172 RepID=A0ABR3PTD9_9TREE